MKIVLLLLVAFFTFAATDRIDDQKYNPKNYILNGGSENGVKNFTAVGGTLASTSVVANKRTGSRAFDFVATNEDGYFESALTTIKDGVNNCMAQVYYKTTSTSLQIDIIDHSDNVVFSDTSIPAAATFKLMQGAKGLPTFTCTTSGESYKIRVTDTASSSWAHVYMDDLVLGDNTNQGTVAQAYEVGKITFGTNCAFVSTSSTYSSPSDGSCTITPAGSVSSVAGYAAFTLPSAERGEYEITLTGAPGFDTGSAPSFKCLYQLQTASNGTSVSEIGQVSNYGDSSQRPSQSSITFHISNPSQTTYYFNMKNDDNSSNCQIGCGAGGCRITVKKFPSSSETVVRSDVLNTNVLLSGDAASATVGNCIKFPTASGYSSSNYSASTGLFTIPKSGYYMATGFVNGASNISYRFKNVTKGTTPIIGYGAAGVGQTPLSGMIYADLNDTVCLSPDGTTDLGANDLFNIVDVSQGFNMPQIVNSVTTKRSAVDRIIRGKATCNNTGSAIVEAGSGDYSVANGASAGKCTFTWVPAFSSTNYQCNFGGSARVRSGDDSKSASALAVNFVDVGGNAAGGTYEFICQGDN